MNAVLPSEKASAEASLAQAQVDLDKTVVRADVTGQLQQFARPIGLHAIDAVGLVHALLLRVQALLMPFQLLVFTGH